MPATGHHHEFRDPIHQYIVLDELEIALVSTEAFRRLRYIHQLALTYLVYPGATHRRFEHSLGVLHLASYAYDIVTDGANIPDEYNFIPQGNSKTHRYWKSVVRAAALLHDIGHLPFSHAAEHRLLPKDWSHEKLTGLLIQHEEISGILNSFSIKPEDVIRVALGPEKYSKYFSRTPFTELESIMSEIITGDSFGVDRIDYLLRDSYHCGVGYGHFDYQHLVRGLRILPSYVQGSREPQLGLDIESIHASQSMVFCRYWMYKQIYLRDVRRIYDLHLCDFLISILDNGKFSTLLEDHLKFIDDHFIIQLRDAARDSSHPGHEHASRISKRNHFRRIYQWNSEDNKINVDADQLLFTALQDELGPDKVLFDSVPARDMMSIFPVKYWDGRISPSIANLDDESNIKPPLFKTEYIFAHPDVKQHAEIWLKKNRVRVIGGGLDV